LSFDIYTRVSEVGGREGESFGSPYEQEASCRSYAATRGWEIDEVVYDGDVSGSTPVDARDLGRLIRKCEAGESEGILCRHLDRFGRNMVEGMLAYKRLDACGTRLVAVADGIDSTDPGAKTLLGFRLVMAEETYDRNRNARMNGKERAVERGVYAAIAPFGYERDAEGRLQPTADAEVVRDIFRQRAEGVGFSEIARGSSLSRSGVRRVVMNRAYLGEQRIPDPARRGEPRVVSQSHVPIVTESQWQAANAVQGHAPVRRGLGALAGLTGIVKCGTCGSSMRVLSYGGGGREKLTYACTRSGCGAASLATSKLDPAVRGVVYEAITSNEPHVAATLANDDRYEHALESVERAQRALDEFRDDVEIQQALGVRDFAAGLRSRREAIEVARRALRETPRPIIQDNSVPDVLPVKRVVAEVFVFPKTAPNRMTLRWHGSDEQVVVPAA
jgi:site-specific DNA recombinase